MAMFDRYKPLADFACPVCGAPQREWQGKDGPCGFFVFREGTAGAVDQHVDEDCRLSDEQIAAQRLPGEFFIYAYDCPCPYPTLLRCSAEAGVWSTSELFTGSAADQQLRGAERREQWSGRLRWLHSRVA